MELDLRGLPCPQPVVQTKKAIDDGGERVIRVIVDNAISRDNVRRYAEGQGCKVAIEEEGGSFILQIHRSLSSEIPDSRGGASLAITAYIESDSMGRGSEELGRILMRAFLKTLPEISPPITKVIFINNGVRLTTEGSDHIETLNDLEGRGMEIYSCGTCLDYFKLLDQVKVGKISNMYDIVTMLANSDRVIKP